MTTTTLPTLTADSRPAGHFHRTIAFAPLRAVIGKEVRENLKFVVFILLVLALIVTTIIWSQTNGLRQPLDQDSALLSQAFETLSFIACPAAAFILALAQILSERFVDLRAFFVHRAITPSRLFLGKALGGLLLYFFAVGIPILILILVSAVSVDAAWIFDIRFARPYLVDFVTGFAYYFAGILLGQRQARLHGSRLVPMGAAIAASLCSGVSPTFGAAFLAVILLDILLLISASNCYTHFGFDTSLGQPLSQTAASTSARSHVWRSLVGRLSLPIVMALGLTLVLGFVLVLAIWGLLARMDSLPREVPYDINVSYYSSLRDGTPIRMDYHSHVIGHTENGVIEKADRTFYDLQGNLLSPAAAQQIASPVALLTLLPSQAPSLSWNDALTYRDSRTVVRFVQSPSEDPAVAPGSAASLRWYYLPLYRYAVGIDPRTHRRAMTFGNTGVLPISSPPQPFADNPMLPDFLVQNDIVFRSPGKIEGSPIPFAHLAGDEKLQSIESFSLLIPNSPITQILITNQRLHFLNATPDGGATPLFTLPIEYPLNQNTLEISRYDDGKIITLKFIPAFPTVPSASHLFVYSPEGELLHRYELPPLSDQFVPAYNSAAQLYLVGTGIIESFRDPLVVRAIIRNLPASLRHQVEHTPDIILSDSRFTTNGLVKYYDGGIVASFLVCTAVAFFLTRRYRFSLLGTILWPLATLLLGPVGLITFLFTQPLPRRIVCPSCHRKRLVTRDLCEHCRAPFPPPPTNGTEILAPTGVPA